MKGLHRSFQRVEDEQIARLDRKRAIERALAKKVGSQKLVLARELLQSETDALAHVGALALNALGIPV